MDVHLIENQFAKIGARAVVQLGTVGIARRDVLIDIARDKRGEYFDISVPQPDTELKVVDLRAGIRHLLLTHFADSQKHKFLCGHDERHWFVAAVPEAAAASNVDAAFEALKPQAVRERQRQLKLKPRKRNKRRNEAFIRQGEWFFVPAPDCKEDMRLVLRNEWLRRGDGKPHVCEELLRHGGEVVYVAAGYPQGVTENQYRKLLKRRPELRKRSWTVQRRNPKVFVRGKIRHSDHKTIVLNGWHEVLVNTEQQSEAMRHVAFID